MTLLKKLLPLALITSFLAGCAGYALVQANTRYVMPDSFSVVPNVSWSRFAAGDIEMWTRDGQLLNQLFLFGGVEDGDPLPIAPLAYKGEKVDSQLDFVKTMTPLDVQDLVLNTLRAQGYVRPEVLSTTPDTFGGRNGFRMEFSLFGADDIERRALIVGTMMNDRLFAVFYMGTTVHYYGATMPEVEAILRSVQFEIEEEAGEV